MKAILKRKIDPPSQGDRDAITSSTTATAPIDPNMNSWHVQYGKDHLERLACDLQLCKQQLKPGSSILEIGSLPLVLTHALHEQGFDTTGVDIDPSRYASVISTLGLNVVKCCIETERLPFETDSIDTILLNEVFEHMRINLVHTLGEIRRVLKPGGMLYLSTPNLHSYRGIKSFLLRKRAVAVGKDIFSEYSKLDSIGHMGHVREYTWVEVGEFLTCVGFKLDEFIFRPGGIPGRIESIVCKLDCSKLPFVSIKAICQPD